MVVGVCRLKLRLPETFSLKDKRRIIKSLQDKIKARFNLSVAEIAFQEEKRFSELALAGVGTARDPIHRVFMKSLELVENDGRGEVVDVEVEWL
ncbi:MAG: DUF503 domain-containing protein [Firmicutes bacterium]|jgi:uncharacterized protein YlxP (DUF503 family)|nr:DUF503 domain-containing protein [Bacillota bacterium]